VTKGSGGSSGARNWIGATMLGVAVALLGAGIAGAASLSDASLTVTPSQLPSQGGAPVAVTVAGSIAQAEQPEEVRSVTVQLDRQLTVRGAHRPTCRPREITNKTPAQARQKCKDALVGSGRVIQRFQYPESGPQDLTLPMLLFNSGSGRVLSYTFVPAPLGPAVLLGRGAASGHSVEIPVARLVGGLTVSFRFQIGRTWSERGRKIGYLSGRCATGTLHNKVTLTMAGNTQSASLTQRCKATG